ncbi:MAG TPA: DnaJ domain-containing protein [Roseiflexaceae bacterium]
MTQDYYETLQVHPRADQDAITAAYARMRDLYDSAKLDGAAEELADLARQKRDAIDRAYAVLGDAVRRAAYDAEQAALRTTSEEGTGVRPSSSVLRPNADEEPLDYRPLPPARRADRPRGFDARPLRAPAAGRAVGAPATHRWVAPVGLAGVVVLIIAISIALTNGSGAPAAPTQTPFDQFEADIPKAQQAAEQKPNDPRAWIDYGDVLYNSAEIVRENAPESQLYQQRLPRWLAATQAYTRALALDPGDAVVRADLAVSACFYGAGKGDQSYVRSGTAEARRAAQAAPDEPRVLLNLGHCLISAQPPQAQEAVEQWKRAVAVAPSGSPFAAQAQQLIAKYGQ